MSLGQIAGLIAALSFAVLVGFICYNLAKIGPILKDLQETVKRVNSTIDVVTKDVDNLSIEVEGLLNKANSLVDDVNHKLKETDPLFTAIGDVGVTVSDLNDSTKHMASNFVDNFGKKSKNPLARLVSSSGKKRSSDSNKDVVKRTETQVTTGISDDDVEAQAQLAELVAAANASSADVSENPERKAKRQKSRRRRSSSRHAVSNQASSKSAEAEKELKSIINRPPSQTAGEIRIK